MNEDMIERVARAICRGSCRGEAHPCDQDSEGICKPEACRDWSRFRHSAYAAIGALKNPPRHVNHAISEGMVGQDERVIAQLGYERGLDAALADWNISCGKGARPLPLQREEANRD